jgi:hypothetical protein
LAEVVQPVDPVVKFTVCVKVAGPVTLTVIAATGKGVGEVPGIADAKAVGPVNGAFAAPNEDDA